MHIPYSDNKNQALFEENNKLECDFCSSKIKINFPSYMLPLPRKI